MNKDAFRCYLRFVQEKNLANVYRSYDLQIDLNIGDNGWISLEWEMPFQPKYEPSPAFSKRTAYHRIETVFGEEAIEAFEDYVGEAFSDDPEYLLMLLNESS